MTTTDRPAAVVLDIEGTTTPISFVYDTLFPYARRNLADFLRAHGHEDAVLADARDMLDLAGAEKPADRDDLIAAATQRFVEHMQADEKSTPLKSLQGKIWRAGYLDATLRGEVFADVPQALERWQTAGIPVYIYSSGSVEAQELLFGHATCGDLTGFLSGYFDTTTGPKKEAASYEQIATRIERPADAIVFATDNLDEARAARDAGWSAVIMRRPGNAELPPHDFPVFESLDRLAKTHTR